MDLNARVALGHPIFNPPDDPDATIWRYMDFTRLVSLLDTSCLYFARCDTLDDPFEGSTAQFNIKMRPEVYGEDFPLTDWSVGREASRRSTFVNCWNLSKRESAAMWGLYVPPSGGVAIRSSYRRLTECFGPLEPQPVAGDGVQRIYIGRVYYVDYETAWIPEDNVFWPFVHKRNSFEFENELRALISRDVLDHPSEIILGGRSRTALTAAETPGHVGLTPQVDLHRLIERIHVSPTAPRWFAELVRAVMAKYEHDPNVVEQSQMTGTAVY